MCMRGMWTKAFRDNRETLFNKLTQGEHFPDHSQFPFQAHVQGVNENCAKGIYLFTKQRKHVLPTWLKEGCGAIITTYSIDRRIRSIRHNRCLTRPHKSAIPWYWTGSVRDGFVILTAHPGQSHLIVYPCLKTLSRIGSDLRSIAIPVQGYLESEDDGNRLTSWRVERFLSTRIGITDAPD